MPLLESLIQTLNEAEYRDLEGYLTRATTRRERKDLEVLRLLREDPSISGQDLSTRLYGKVNLNAYHTIRKRLMRTIQEFITVRQFEEDAGKGEELRMWVRSSRLMLSRGRAEAARKLLEKGKKMAHKYDLYPELMRILATEVEYADELGLKHESLVEEWRKAQELTDLQERIDLAYSLLRIKLREARLTGRSGELESLVRSQLDQLEMDLHLSLPASVVYKMMTIIRMAIIASKQYHQFDPLVEQTYLHLKESGKLSSADPSVHIGFLYMIAHTKYRTRKLDDARRWLDRLAVFMDDTKNRTVLEYLGRFFLLKAAISNYSGDNREAVKILRSALERTDLRIVDVLNIRLNLSVYEFQAQQYRDANAVLVNIEMSDKECERHMGPEWRFKKDLIQVILFAEIGHIDLAMTRIKWMRSQYAPLFSSKQHKRSAGFLKVVQWIIETPEMVKTPGFSQKVEDAIQRLPGNMEDLQAMTFYTWAKSKMVGRRYYDVMIETVATFGKDRVTDY